MKDVSRHNSNSAFYGVTCTIHNKGGLKNDLVLKAALVGKH